MISEYFPQLQILRAEQNNWDRDWGTSTKKLCRDKQIGCVFLDVSTDVFGAYMQTHSKIQEEVDLYIPGL